MIGDRVVKMRILNSKGELIAYNLSDDRNKITRAVRGHLGLFGIVYDMTMRVDDPLQVVRVNNRWLKAGNVFYQGGLRTLLDQNWSTQIIWFPFNSLVLEGRVGAFVTGILQRGLWNPREDEVWVHTVNKGKYKFT